jgi:hypothetical protein
MIAPKGVAAAVSLALAVAVSGCAKSFEVPIEIPIQPRMDVSPFSRVLVAGFISGGTDDVDANLETVRLLRSQLRSRSNLRVIEADVLPLAEIAREQMRARTDVTGTSPAAARPMPSLPLAMQADGQGGVPEVQLPAQSADETIRTEADLERYQAIFSDEAFWQRVGEEHQQPLIVTGTVLFTNTQQAGFVNTNREVIDQLGRRAVQPMRVYMERKGFIIEPRFIFIDGRTGTVLASDRFHEEVLYPAQQNTPALSSFFELMDRLLPSFLGSFGTQRIRGTRVLLK